MATPDLRALTQAFRRAQIQRAALIAAAVAAYYQKQVDVEDAGSVERWLELVLPRIMRQHDFSAREAAKWGTLMRRIELPDADRLTFEPSVGAVPEQVRRSLMVVGPGDYLNKASVIRTLEELNPQQEKALLIEAKQVTAEKVAAATVRHIQNGSRQTIIDNAAGDRLALGYVRVTKADPCFFCAMLASRGLIFAKDSFDESDARFTGEGTVKVHDGCGCTDKVIYRREDPVLKDTEKFTDMWERWGAGGGDALLRFRRGYEHFMATGEYLDWDVVNDSELFRARNS